MNGDETQLDRLEKKLDRILELLEKPKRQQRAAQTFSDAYFERFWLLYPRKVGKPAARRAWDKLKLRPKEKLDMLEVVREWNKAWNKIETRFIPHPSTWLNQRRFEDEIEISVPAPKAKPVSLDDWIKIGRENGIEPKPGENAAAFIARVQTA